MWRTEDRKPGIEGVKTRALYNEKSAAPHRRLFALAAAARIAQLAAHLAWRGQRHASRGVLRSRQQQRAARGACFSRGAQFIEIQALIGDMAIGGLEDKLSPGGYNMKHQKAYRRQPSAWHRRKKVIEESSDESRKELAELAEKYENIFECGYSMKNTVSASHSAMKKKGYRNISILESVGNGGSQKRLEASVYEMKKGLSSITGEEKTRYSSL